MTIESSLYTVLAAVTAETWPAGEVPQTPTLPYLVFRRVDSAPAHRFETRTPSRTKVRLQVNVVAATYVEAKTLAAQVATAMEAAPFPNWLDNEHDAPALVTRQAGVVMDFMAWQ